MEEITPLNNVIGLDEKDIDRFLSKFKRGSVDECWEWEKKLTPGGYGTFSLNFKNYPAHRICWELCFGPIPKGKQLHHKCINRACVNPSHLEEISPKDHCAVHSSLRTHCKRGHEFTPGNTTLYGGIRACRKCTNWRKNQARRSRNPKFAELPYPFSKLYCKNEHPLFGDNMVLRKNWNGTYGRHCRACINAAVKKHYRAHKDKLMAKKEVSRSEKRREKVIDRAAKIRALDMQNLADPELVESIKEILSDMGVD